MNVVAKPKEFSDAGVETLTIPPPNLKIAFVPIIGTAPLVIHKFSEKSRKQMMAKHIAGSTAKKSTKREAKDYEQTFKDAQHIGETNGERWHGFPAPAIRAGMISACRTVGFKMTIAKLSVFCEHDGVDIDDATPLVKITGPEPKILESVVRNATGVADVRWRPAYHDWGAELRIRFDADQFTLQDVINLLARVGSQVGIGEGRPDSKQSSGQGWGTFRLDPDNIRVADIEFKTV